MPAAPSQRPSPLRRPPSPAAADAALAQKLFEPFDLKARRTVVAAVSGGSDSLALLLLLHACLAGMPDGPALLAVTVDHALRAGSAAEAEAVAAIAGRLGIAHEIRRWEGPKPSAGVAAAAREARYGLLAQAAAKAGTDLVLTGHTADDQAETFAMRALRGEGRGLAGMAPATLFDGATWILRPLLGVRRETLRETLRRAGLSWIDDPTNTDRRYERPRLRAALSGRSADVEALCRQAAAAAAERQDLGERAAALIDAGVAPVAPGVVRLAPALLAQARTQAGLYTLRLLLCAAGGLPQLPPAEKVEALLQRLEAPGGRGTLARALAERDGDGLVLLRERRNLPPALAAVDGALWDGRWRLSRSAHAGPAMVEAASTAASGAVVARFTAPGGDAAPGWTARAVPAPWARYLPAFDWMPAAALAKKIGAAPLPPPPWCGHARMPA